MTIIYTYLNMLWLDKTKKERLVDNTDQLRRKRVRSLCSFREHHR